MTNGLLGSHAMHGEAYAHSAQSMVVRMAVARGVRAGPGAVCMALGGGIQGSGAGRPHWAAASVAPAGGTGHPTNVIGIVHATGL